MMYRKQTVIRWDTSSDVVAAARVNIIERRGSEKERNYVAFGTLIGLQARDDSSEAKEEAVYLLKGLKPELQLAFAAGYAAAYLLCEVAP